MAERLRRAIAAAEVYTTSSADVICVTASFGLAQLSSRHGHPEEWFHAADMALNRAKQSGRNRVEFASFSHVLPKPQHTQAVQPIEDNPGVEANGQTVVSEEEAVYAETAWQWIVRTRPSHGFVASSVRQPNYTSLFTSII
ncbi:MAG: diguanylate cyclase [Anaerolineae bacterium]|nr:diguanylate cyclase [Anaerolineae bacterium]